MTKKELAEKTAEALASKGKQHITKTQVEAVLDALGDVAAAELLGGGEISMPSLGKLKPKPRKGCTRRNPGTGAPVDVPAHTVVVFEAGKELKEALR